MPSPFPGMDPYIESQGRWHSFHTAFIAACSDAINEHLPPPYFATVEGRVVIDASEFNATMTRGVSHDAEPDVAVLRTGRSEQTLATGGTATLLPHRLPQAVVTLDQPTQKLIEIYGLPDERLVTTVELLSPSNKRSGRDREAFLLKRTDLLHRGVNLVDLDMLIGGHRLPFLAPLPVADYYAMVTRADAAHVCDVYGWTVRDPLPTVPIPLGPGPSDVPLDLASVFAGVYRRSHYDRALKYGRPLVGPWAAADEDWIVARAAQAIAH